MVARGHRNLGFGSATLDQHRFGMRLADSLEVAAAYEAPAPTLGKIDFEQFELELGTPAVEYEYFHATASAGWAALTPAFPLGMFNRHALS